MLVFQKKLKTVFAKLGVILDRETKWLGEAYHFKMLPPFDFRDLDFPHHYDCKRVLTHSQEEGSSKNLC